jgi:hypothetical protein
MKLFFFNFKKGGPGRVTQEVVYLPRKYETLSSNPSIAKKIIKLARKI